MSTTYLVDSRGFKSVGCRLYKGLLIIRSRKTFRLLHHQDCEANRATKRVAADAITNLSTETTPVMCSCFNHSSGLFDLRRIGFISILPNPCWGTRRMARQPVGEFDPRKLLLGVQVKLWSYTFRVIQSADERPHRADIDPMMSHRTSTMRAEQPARTLGRPIGCRPLLQPDNCLYGKSYRRGKRGARRPTAPFAMTMTRTE